MKYVSLMLSSDASLLVSNSVTQETLELESINGFNENTIAAVEELSEDVKTTAILA